MTYCAGNTAAPRAATPRGVDYPLKEKRAWRDARQAELHEQAGNLGEIVCSCADCGANVVISSGEALGKCDFCSGKYVRREFLESDSLPELVIPFLLTRDETLERLRAWCESNKNRPEAAAVSQNLKRLNGFYLPYQLVRGPVECRVTRDNTAREYSCMGFADGIAVNTSSQLDNLVLEAAEPFDWSGVREFDLGLLAGQRVKLQDISGEALESRVFDEVKSSYTPLVEKTMQNKGVSIYPSMSEMLIMPALMPFYILKAGRVQAVVNAQTGRVAVSAKEKKSQKWWLLEPVAVSVAAFVLTAAFLWYRAGALLPEDIWQALGFAAVIALIAFTVFGERRKAKVTRPVYTTENTALARSDDGRLVETGKAPESPAQTEPVFTESIAGEAVPVKVSFYPPGRVILWTLAGVAALMLPVILGFLFAGSAEGLWLGGAAAWWCICAVVMPAYFMKLGRVEIYNHPVFRRITSDGRTVPIPKKEYRASAPRGWIKTLFAPGVRGATLGLLGVLIVCSLLVAWGGGI